MLRYKLCNIKNTKLQQHPEKEFNTEGLSNRSKDGKDGAGGLSHLTSLSFTKPFHYFPKTNKVCPLIWSLP